MIIRKFNDSDIKRAGELSALTWGDFFIHESQELQAFIYSFMIEYYDLNRDFSFSILDDNELKGFLLAFKKDDYYASQNFSNKIVSLKNEVEQKIALDLFHYLESCGKEVKSRMGNDDIMLGLFVSIQKGCGKMLLARLNQFCKENQMQNVYLWTDTTCDCEYYGKHNFILDKEKKDFVNNKMVKTLIYSKEIL